MASRYEEKPAATPRTSVTPSISPPSIATAAAVHLACAVPNVDWGVSLTHFYLAEDIVRQPLAIRDGEATREDGGGICQVASTLYNAALRANLLRLTRHSAGEGAW